MSQREIFSAKDTLAHVLAAVDERVFHLIDCYPPECTIELSFGLYSQWFPKEWPIEPLLPKLSSAVISPLETASHSSVPIGVTLLTPVPEEEESNPPSSALTSNESTISKTPTPSISLATSEVPEADPTSPHASSLNIQQDPTPIAASLTEASTQEPAITPTERLALAPLFYGAFFVEVILCSQHISLIHLSYYQSKPFTRSKRRKAQIWILKLETASQ